MRIATLEFLASPKRNGPQRHDGHDEDEDDDDEDEDDDK
jgi:hypothetical protein